MLVCNFDLVSGYGKIIYINRLRRDIKLIIYKAYPEGTIFIEKFGNKFEAIY